MFKMLLAEIIRGYLEETKNDKTKREMHRVR